MAEENLLILGATGYIGTYITTTIVNARKSFGRIVIFTSVDTAEKKAEHLDGLKREGVEVVVGDVGSEEDLVKAFEGIDTIVSAVGRNVIAQQIDWINLAIKAGTVKRFFPSEYGTDIEYDSTSKDEPPHQNKLKVRAALRAQDKLEYTYVVTGPFAYGYLGAGNSGSEVGSFNVQEKRAVVLGDGKGRISLTTDTDVGRLVVAALLHPQEAKNKALRVNSFTTTPVQIVAEFEKQTGEKWKVDYTSFERLKEIEKKAYEEKWPGVTGITLRRIWGEGRTLYEKRDNWAIDAENTETLADAVKVVILQQIAGGE